MLVGLGFLVCFFIIADGVPHARMQNDQNDPEEHINKPIVMH